MDRHVHEEYPVNIIVEPGVSNEVKDDLPFAFTPPNNGTWPMDQWADKEMSMQSYIGLLMRSSHWVGMERYYTLHPFSRLHMSLQFCPSRWEL